MNNMPAHHIPLAQAEQQLTQRIESGRELIQRIRDKSLAPRLGESEEELWNRFKRWRDFNRTWCEVNLGNHVSEEFKTLGEYNELRGSITYRDVPARIQGEILLLESIRERLPIWASEPQAGSNSGHDTRTSRNAPIFIVHGSDTLRAESVAHTVTSATGRPTIILRDQPNLGRTLIEKFEQHAAQVSYAIIILTPDDQGGHAGEPGTKPRGRQNVVFEMGYFYGLIGRSNVSVLIRPGVEKPSDTEGIAYITFDDNRAWKNELLRELEHAGFDVHL